MAQRKILCVTSDQSVTKRWCMNLIAEGYDAVPARRAKHASELLSERRYDLVVIGYTFAHDEKLALANVARQKHCIPVLMVCTAESDTKIPADDYISAGESDNSLMEAVAVLLLQNERTAVRNRAAAL
jgi:DNA-binding response OmpR family regulator